MGEVCNLDSLILRFDEHISALARLDTKKGGLDSFTSFKGNQITRLYYMYKNDKLEQKYFEIQKCIEDFMFGCETLAHNEKDETVKSKYLTIKAEADYIGSTIKYQKEIASVSPYQPVLPEDMSKRDAKIVETAENCPSCNHKGLSVVFNNASKKYHVRCKNCGGRFRTNVEFDSIMCAVDVWNLCCRLSAAATDRNVSEKSAEA